MAEKNDFQVYDLLTKHAKGLKNMSDDLDLIYKSLISIRDVKEASYRVVVNLGNSVESKQTIDILNKEIQFLRDEINKGELTLKRLESELDRVINGNQKALYDAKMAFAGGYYAASKKVNFDSAWNHYLKKDKGKC